MIKDGKPYKSKKVKLLDVILTNKDYTPISKSDDHSVADGTVVDMSVLIRSLASFAVSKCIDFNDFAGSVLDHVECGPGGPRGNPGVQVGQDLSSIVMPSCYLILMTFCRKKTTSYPSTSPWQLGQKLLTLVARWVVSYIYRKSKHCNRLQGLGGLLYVHR